MINVIYADGSKLYIISTTLISISNDVRIKLIAAIDGLLAKYSLIVVKKPESCKRSTIKNSALTSVERNCWVKCQKKYATNSKNKRLYI